MALDIIEMPKEELTCPHCNKVVLLLWQMAHYGDGGDSPQFIGLEKGASAEAIRNKTYPRVR